MRKRVVPQIFLRNLITNVTRRITNVIEVRQNNERQLFITNVTHRITNVIEVLQIDEKQCVVYRIQCLRHPKRLIVYYMLGLYIILILL